MKDKRSLATAIFVVMLFLLLLPTLYLGGYYAMVRRKGLVVEGPGVYELPVEYSFGNDFAQRLFYPAHMLDRRIRPSYWKFKRFAEGTYPFEFNEKDEIQQYDLPLGPSQDLSDAIEVNQAELSSGNGVVDSLPTSPEFGGDLPDAETLGQ